MDWLQDMTGRWVRIMKSAGDARTPLDEAVHQISSISEAPAGKGRFGRQKRDAATPAEASAVTALCRLLIAGVLVSDLMIDKLRELGLQTREQVLAQLSGDLPQKLPDEQLRALQAELSGSCALLQDPGNARPELAKRVEQLFRIAEEEASAHIDAARAEAAQIVSSARTQQPCPRCGAPAHGQAF
jgi:hypothetical protein